jgi:hypothetical protein
VKDTVHRRKGRAVWEVSGKKAKEGQVKEGAMDSKGNDIY